MNLSSVREKVVRCAVALSGWASSSFGEVKKRIKRKEEELELSQSKTLDGVILARCKEIVLELDELHRLHDYWHVHARENELKLGDKNTTYFHHKGSQQKRHNMILKIKDADGVWSSNEEEVGTIISNYFTEIFQHVALRISRKLCLGSQCN